jgi:hypothetical protein
LGELGGVGKLGGLGKLGCVGEFGSLGEFGCMGVQHRWEWREVGAIAVRLHTKKNGRQHAEVRELPAVFSIYSPQKPFSNFS